MFTVDGESYRFKQVTRLKRKPDRFCAAGAVYYANYELTGRKRIPLELHAIVGELAEVNDDKGHRPVLRKLDEMLHSI